MRRLVCSPGASRSIRSQPNLPHRYAQETPDADRIEGNERYAGFEQPLGEIVSGVRFQWLKVGSSPSSPTIAKLSH
jgi:hypothetical protein